MDLIDGELRRGVANIKAVGGNVFQNKDIAIKAKYGSFGGFLRSRTSEFSVSQEGDIKRVSLATKPADRRRRKREQR